MLNLGGGGGKDHFREYIKVNRQPCPTSKTHMCPCFRIQFPGVHGFKKAGKVSSLMLSLATVCPVKRKPSQAASQAPPPSPDGLSLASLKGLRLQGGQPPPHTWWTVQPSLHFFALDRMVRSSRSLPASREQANPAPSGPQRHPHSSTIMSL